MGEVERVLIPYFGENLPKRAETRALEKLEKGGELFLLHILDEAPTRSLRYRTGQFGDGSEMVKTFRKGKGERERPGKALGRHERVLRADVRLRSEHAKRSAQGRKVVLPGSWPRDTAILVEKI
ncbi:hypothetical protein AKJ61_01695 [candidate division MSBL1 archaeon SCGC-AAA259B11]|uniref:UspA domain-containing protein n=1 Tax=candidate division MSBL1 archaeon SCGC-AAA259B11 TaxID=1698260 RepID=A0A133U700_9EURY|nr:hypothetical protein AKJ61_01695 [candidate division MSBL1 archaeon SCGC-AAA259B11]